LAGLGFVWGGMFAIGYLIFQQTVPAGIAVVIMIASFGHIWYHCIRKLDR
jgi:hypothetical protein